MSPACRPARSDSLPSSHPPIPYQFVTKASAPVRCCQYCNEWIRARLRQRAASVVAPGMTSMPHQPLLPAFSAPYAPDDRGLAATLLATARLAPEREQRIGVTATGLIGAIRSADDRFGGVEQMLREFALSTKEGLALMVLAEALLRVPDTLTTDRFIEDKLGQGDFAHHHTRSGALLVNASAWALGISARIVQAGETPQGTIGQLAKRLGVPAVRAATRQAMRLMGNHFVLGETIEAALERTRALAEDDTRYSYDMLGEGARARADAARYFAAYARAIDAIGRTAGNAPLPARPGISVKLSALHP
ncbi:MAG TPA: proline dehydrogenase family protein, partial [Rhodospirillales bacterium]|nr:proline dehydrogenase family protein [Rhodospirillales bacterium]